MSKLINLSDRIFVAGHKGMVGSAIVRRLKKYGYGLQHEGTILSVPKSELDLEDLTGVNHWMSINKPNVVILAAAKVGGIYANLHYPKDFRVVEIHHS